MGIAYEIVKYVTNKKNQTLKTSGVYKSSAISKTEISLAEFNGWKSLISSTRTPFPDYAAVSDTLSTKNTKNDGTKLRAQHFLWRKIQLSGENSQLMK